MVPSANFVHKPFTSYGLRTRGGTPLSRRRLPISARPYGSRDPPKHVAVNISQYARLHVQARMLSYAPAHMGAHASSLKSESSSCG